MGVSSSSALGTQDTSLKKTTFFLYTRSNPDNPEELEIGNLTSTYFNPEHPVRILVHGYNSGSTAYINTAGREALLRKGDYNVIVMDWGKVANSLMLLTQLSGIGYTYATIPAYNAGKLLAKFIDAICEVWQVPLTRIGLIGHSLGACVIDTASRNLQGGRKVAFAVALDPAYPLSPLPLIDKDAADYVQVIHTDAVLGHFFCRGDADFFPNYGKLQPECSRTVSHQRAVHFWVESINSCTGCEGFWATPCRAEDVQNECCKVGGEDQVVMGGDPVDVTTKGCYYLETAQSRPFAMGKR